MTTRPAERVLTGRPSSCVEVILGFGQEGRPAVTVHPSGYHRTPFSITDPAVARELAADLVSALAHLEPSTNGLDAEAADWADSAGAGRPEIAP